MRGERIQLGGERTMFNPNRSLAHNCLMTDLGLMMFGETILYARVRQYRGQDESKRT
jgi:hypothetical protein